MNEYFWNVLFYQQVKHNQSASTSATYVNGNVIHSETLYVNANLQLSENVSSLQTDENVSKVKNTTMQNEMSAKVI